MVPVEIQTITVFCFLGGTRSHDWSYYLLSTYIDIMPTKRRRGGNNKTRKCLEKLVLTQYRKYVKTFETQRRDLDKRIQKTTDATAKKTLLGQQREGERRMKSFLAMMKRVMETQYCNPGCVATAYEPGKGVSKRYRARLSRLLGKPANQEHMNDERLRIFGDQTNVLVDGFYQGLSAKQLQKMKAAGAVSGCVSTFIPSDFV